MDKIFHRLGLIWHLLTYFYLQTTLTEAVPTRNVKLSKHPVLLVVSFDGFRADYLTKTEVPNLKALQNEGVTVPYMQASFPTNTFPNHLSIVTGLYPDSHGITDNSVWDPLYNKSLSGFNDDPEFWNFHPDILPFWIRNEQAGDGRISACYMWPSSNHAYGVNATLRPTHYIPIYSDNVPWDERVDTVISWITHDTQPANIIFLYHNQPDSEGHAVGTDDARVLAEIRATDNRTGYLVQKLKEADIYDSINLIILSDHGMHTVPLANMINTTLMVDPSLYFRHGGTPTHHIRPIKNEDADQIYEAFKAESLTKNFSVYRKEEMGFVNYTSNRRIADILLVTDLGYGFQDTYFVDGIRGVHGYDNRFPTMRPIFIARGPLFKKGFISPSPINNVDLVPLFSRIAGVPLGSTNGTFDHVANLLDNDDTSTTTSPSTSTSINDINHVQLLLTALVWSLVTAMS